MKKEKKRTCKNYLLSRFIEYYMDKFELNLSDKLLLYYSTISLFIIDLLDHLLLL